MGRTPDAVYLVMDYAEHDLKVLLTPPASASPSRSHPTPPFRLPAIKRLMHSLLSALAYLHAHFILHRDIKTSNLLYTNTGRLLLADFGLARRFPSPPSPPPSHPLTPTVVTLWYRAPELLLSASTYGPPVDLFSAGCVMAELVRGGKALWPGTGELDQLGREWDMMGGLGEEEVKEVVGSGGGGGGGGTVGWRLKPGDGVCKLRSLFPNRLWEEGGLSEAGYALLRGMLELNPAKRTTAAEALRSAWFMEEPRMEREDRMPTFASSNENSHRTRARTPPQERHAREERQSRFHVG